MPDFELVRDTAPGSCRQGHDGARLSKLGDFYVLIGTMRLGNASGAENGSGDIVLGVPGELGGGVESLDAGWVVNGCQCPGQILDERVIGGRFGGREEDVAQFPGEAGRVLAQPGIELNPAGSIG